MIWTGGPWVVDTSAWARASEPGVSELWADAARKGELVACPLVTLELLFDARDSIQVEEVAAALASLRQAPITRSVTDAAVMAVRELAANVSAGSHRVRVPDALIASAASELGLGVLHYDHHFDRLSEVLGFHSQWIAPAGTMS